MIFENRQEAGEFLALKLEPYKDSQSIVLALPRGGIPLGFEIGKSLHLPFFVFVVRKIGAPNNKEFGIGAIAEGNVKVFDQGVIQDLHIPEKELQEIIKEETQELKRRVALYRNNKALPRLKNKTIIIVDDGLATGVTARAAIAAIKKHTPKEIIFASPVCAADTAQEFEKLVDMVVCVTIPEHFSSVGQWYKSFPQMTDEEVIDYLQYK